MTTNTIKKCKLVVDVAANCTCEETIRIANKVHGIVENALDNLYPGISQYHIVNDILNRNTNDLSRWGFRVVAEYETGGCIEKDEDTGFVSPEYNVNDDIIEKEIKKLLVSESMLELDTVYSSTINITAA